MKWNPRRCGMLLKFAAIQTLVFKVSGNRTKLYGEC